MARGVIRVVLLCLFAGCAASGTTASSRARQPTARESAIQKYPEKLYRVPSGSMEPTLSIGERILIQHIPIPLKLLGETFWPKPGWIAVFHPPEGAESQECGPGGHVVKPGGAACDTTRPKSASVQFVKRIVAGPGEEMYVKEGHVYLRAHSSEPFVRESDSYIRSCGNRPECDFPTPIRIPAGPVVHDGRQPRRIRRQPLLGTGPKRVDSRLPLRDRAADNARRKPATDAIAACLVGSTSTRS